MSSSEIRRIRDEDADAVAELWDRMCREVRTGGPLSADGRRRIAGMLAATAWHRDTFCLVAERDGRIAGFALGHVDAGDGLLPEVVGEIQESWGPAGVRAALVAAVMAELRRLGVRTLRTRVADDEPDEREFWAGLGFEADMVVMSRYE